MTFRGHYRYSGYGCDCDNRIGTIFSLCRRNKQRAITNNVMKVYLKRGRHMYPLQGNYTHITTDRSLTV